MKFTGLHYRPTGEPESRYLCGRVNAKNAFGGYAGWQPFAAKVRIDKQTGLVYPEGSGVCLRGLKLPPMPENLP